MQGAKEEPREDKVSDNVGVKRNRVEAEPAVARSEKWSKAPGRGEAQMIWGGTEQGVWYQG